MSNSEPLTHQSPQDMPADLSQLVQVVQSAAQSREGDCVELLTLLRLLNELHYNIRDTLFREALPDNRQHLYRLLKDMENKGGWPYIKRMKLTALLEHLKEDAEETEREPQS